MSASDHHHCETNPENLARYRRTKIIATVGPASRSPEKVRALIEAGVNVFRLNFSHGSHAEHRQSLETIRAISEEMCSYTAVLQDLSGPKIRIANVKGDFIEVATDEELLLFPTSGPACSLDRDIYVETVDPTKVLEAGNRVLLADGLIELQVVEVLGSRCVRCQVKKGGRIRSRVGIAFPDSEVDLPATTEKDLVDLEWGIKNGVDFVAISFVRNGADILRLRDYLQQHSGSCQIIAKIERKIALQNIDEILSACDGLMVARGDLGLDLPIEQVPTAQRKLIEKANYAGKPVIVATQMMHSMITSPRPTRAEVSDIAAAVMTGADAVMLSDETTIGEHPVESVRFLALISKEAEKAFEFEEYRLHLRDADRQTVPDAIAYAACAAALKVGASAIVACTETGNSARLVAKYRPVQRLFGASPRVETLRRMSLYRGVIPVLVPYSDSDVPEFDRVVAAVSEIVALPSGSILTMLGGLKARVAGGTSLLHIRPVGEPAQLPERA